jgi:hypothetical protein
LLGCAGPPRLIMASATSVHGSSIADDWDHSLHVPRGGDVSMEKIPLLGRQGWIGFQRLCGPDKRSSFCCSEREMNSLERHLGELRTMPHDQIIGVVQVGAFFFFWGGVVFVHSCLQTHGRRLRTSKMSYFTS